MKNSDVIYFTYDRPRAVIGTSLLKQTHDANGLSFINEINLLKNKN